MAAELVVSDVLLGFAGGVLLTLVALVGVAVWWANR